MIAKKYESLVFAFINAAFMSGLMSFIITFLNMGMIDNFISVWLNSYWKAFLVAVPIILFITPKIRKIVSSIIK